MIMKRISIAVFLCLLLPCICYGQFPNKEVIAKLQQLMDKLEQYSIDIAYEIQDAEEHLVSPLALVSSDVTNMYLQLKKLKAMLLEIPVEPSDDQAEKIAALKMFLREFNPVKTPVWSVESSIGKHNSKVKGLIREVKDFLKEVRTYCK